MAEIINDAAKIIQESITAVRPELALNRLLLDKQVLYRKVTVVAVGKAAYTMAKAAHETLGKRIERGYVITKYGHLGKAIPGFTCFEAGHPTPDENTRKATEAVLNELQGLSADDMVLFLLSGGASALFELPMVDASVYEKLIEDLLKSGADITEMNTVRKHLSFVKGGKFARFLSPAKIHTIVLSDVIGSRLDVIGSGPTVPDFSTSEEALHVIDKYGIEITEEVRAALSEETPKEVDNNYSFVIGDVSLLVDKASQVCRRLGYETVVLTDTLACEAKEAGAFMAAIARSHQNAEKPLAFVAGGETVVHVSGHGKGGRNQEIALSAALGIADCKNTCIFSVGSDGTDGPTDAAGGIVTEETLSALVSAGVNAEVSLKDNDAYHALEAVQSLIMTGPTGTNVNDLMVLLIRP